MSERPPFQIHPSLVALKQTFEREIERHEKRLLQIQKKGDAQDAIPTTSIDLASFTHSVPPAPVVQKPIDENSSLEEKPLSDTPDEKQETDSDRETSDGKADTLRSNRLSASALPFGPTSSKRYQSVFLIAALQLLEEKTTGRNGFQQDQRPCLPKSTLLAGHLKKSKDTPFPIFSQKYCVLSYGAFEYFCDGARPAALNEDRKKVVLDRRRCICRVVNSQRFHHKYVFEIVQYDKHDPTKSTRRLWMAKSLEERTIWMNAINEAMQTPADGTGSTRTSFIDQQHVRIFISAQEQMRSAKDKSTYLKALSSTRPSDEGLILPLEWIHQQRRSVGRKPSTMDQVFKDISRDKVELNGTLYNGADGPEIIIGAFTNCLMEITSEAKESTLTEAEALTVVRDILLTCNRTQSGGDSYETSQLLCENSDLIVLCPSALEAEPLKFRVSLVRVYGPSPPTSPTRRQRTSRSFSVNYHFKHKCDAIAPEVCLEGSTEDKLTPLSSPNENSGGVFAAVWPESEVFQRKRRIASSSQSKSGPAPDARPSHMQLQVQVEASTQYKVCDANPQGNTSDTWAEITASYKQRFSYASFYGTVHGPGAIQVITKIL